MERSRDEYLCDFRVEGKEKRVDLVFEGFSVFGLDFFWDLYFFFDFGFCEIFLYLYNLFLCLV